MTLCILIGDRCNMVLKQSFYSKINQKDWKTWASHWYSVCEDWKWEKSGTSDQEFSEGFRLGPFHIWNLRAGSHVCCIPTTKSSRRAYKRPASRMRYCLNVPWFLLVLLMEGVGIASNLKETFFSRKQTFCFALYMSQCMNLCIWDVRSGIL